VVTYEFGKVLCAIEIASSVHRTTAEQHTIDNTDINSIKHRSYFVKLLCAVRRRADAVRVARQRNALLIVQCLGLVGQQGLLVQVDLQDGRHRGEHRRTYPEL
jgi:hypothetical protein